MPVDPVYEPILAAQARQPRIGPVDVVEVREQLAANPLFQVAVRVPVAQVTDLEMPGPGGPIPLRRYLPLEPLAPGALPVLVWLHGGAWAFGGLDSHDAMCREICARWGGLVLSVDYRLAPEHPFPAALDDAYAALVWTTEHAAELGGDAGFLAVGGDSAGGNLAPAAALLARDRHGPSLAAQVLVYPALDDTCSRASMRSNGRGYMVTRRDIEWYWSLYLAKPEDGRTPYAAPLRARRLARLPPALIMTAEFDPLRDEGEEYGARLAAAGVHTSVSRYDGQLHGFARMLDVAPASKQAMQEIADYLRDLGEPSVA